MSKLVKDLQKSQCPQLIHIKDITHLIHVDHALHSPSMNVVRQLVIRFGAVFKHASKLGVCFMTFVMRMVLQMKRLASPPISCTYQVVFFLQECSCSLSPLAGSVGCYRQ